MSEISHYTDDTLSPGKLHSSTKEDDSGDLADTEISQDIHFRRSSLTPDQDTTPPLLSPIPSSQADQLPKKGSRSKPAAKKPPAKPKNNYVVNINVSIPDPDVEEIPVNVQLTEEPAPQQVQAKKTAPKKPRKQPTKRTKEPGKDVCCQTSPPPDTGASSASHRHATRKKPARTTGQGKDRMQQMMDDEVKWLKEQMEEMMSGSYSDTSSSD